MENLEQELKIRLLLTTGIENVKIKWHQLTKKEIAIASKIILAETLTIEDPHDLEVAIKLLQKVKQGRIENVAPKPQKAPLFLDRYLVNGKCISLKFSAAFEQAVRPLLSENEPTALAVHLASDGEATPEGRGMAGRAQGLAGAQFRLGAGTATSGRTRLALYAHR